MIHFKILNILLAVFMFIFLSNCSKIRDSAGVTRKTFDEYQIVENPPLVIPPDFNLVPLDQLQQKDIENIDQELAKEILFGLNDEKENDEIESTTMNSILLKANANDVSKNIRKEIDEDILKEKNTKGIFNMNWKNETEVLDAVEESKRIRNKTFNNESISKGDVPIKKKDLKIKKKKKFLFF